LNWLKAHSLISIKTEERKNGGKKEVKIYLGRAKDFDNDTMSIRAKEDAKRKMSETLRRRKDHGEI
jgi:hypothetical protein